jgi:hypothetical protein
VFVRSGVVTSNTGFPTECKEFTYAIAGLAPGDYYLLAHDIPNRQRKSMPPLSSSLDLRRDTTPSGGGGMGDVTNIREPVSRIALPVIRNMTDVRPATTGFSSRRGALRRR